MKKRSTAGSVFAAVKRFVKYAIGVLMVNKCPSCEALVRYRGTLCPECYSVYVKEREKGCIYCHLPAELCVCSTRELKYCRPMEKSMHSYMFYDRRSDVFLYTLSALKKSPDRASEIFFAKELAAEITRLAAQNRQHLSDWYVTFPPRPRKSRLENGFDQSEGLAKRIAAYTGMKFENIIGRSPFSVKSQKGLSGVSRRANAKKIYHLKKNADAKGKKYIIIDDVITTGSTMRQCQKLLLSAGARAAFPVSIAKTYYRGAGYDRPVKRTKRPDTAWFMDQP